MNEPVTGPGNSALTASVRHANPEDLTGAFDLSFCPRELQPLYDFPPPGADFDGATAKPLTRIRRLQAWALFAGAVTVGVAVGSPWLLGAPRTVLGLPIGFFMFLLSALPLVACASLCARMRPRTTARAAVRPASRDFGDPRCSLAVALAALATAVWALTAGLGIEREWRVGTAVAGAAVFVVAGWAGLVNSIKDRRAKNGR